MYSSACINKHIHTYTLRCCIHCAGSSLWIVYLSGFRNFYSQSTELGTILDLSGGCSTSLFTSIVNHLLNAQFSSAPFIFRFYVQTRGRGYNGIFKHSSLYNRLQCAGLNDFLFYFFDLQYIEIIFVRDKIARNPLIFGQFSQMQD